MSLLAISHREVPSRDLVLSHIYTLFRKIFLQIAIRFLFKEVPHKYSVYRQEALKKLPIERINPEKQRQICFYIRQVLS